jgi:hypothetical protein
MNANAIAVCQSEYLAAEDLPNGKLGIVIKGVEPVPSMPQGGKKGAARKNKNVLITRGPGKKALIFNPTNQWATALLLGTTDWREWIGKRLVLRTDVDVDIETRTPCRSVRVADSPDSTPERRAEYQRQWGAGDRVGGKLARRIKRAYRLYAGPLPERKGNDDPMGDLDPHAPDEEPPDMPPPRYEPSVEKDDFDDGVAGGETGGPAAETKAPVDETPPDAPAPEQKRMREPGEDDI